MSLEAGIWASNQPSKRRTDKVGRRVANQAINNFLGSLRRLDCVCYAIIIFTLQYLTHTQPSYLWPRPKKGSPTFWMLCMGSFGHIFAKVHQNMVAMTWFDISRRCNQRNIHGFTCVLANPKPLFFPWSYLLRPNSNVEKKDFVIPFDTILDMKNET